MKSQLTKLSLLLTLSIPAWANYALLGHITPIGGTTSSAYDTTGATLLVALAADYQSSACNPGIVSDSKSNTWISGANQGGTNTNTCIWYVLTPTVGTGHTFTMGGNFPRLHVMYFSGAGTFGVDVGAGNGSTATLQPTSISAGNGALLVSITMDGAGSPGAPSIDSSFTILDTGLDGVYRVTSAYLIITSAAAINPTWTYGATVDAGTAMANFAPASYTPPGGTTPLRRRVIQ